MCICIYCLQLCILIKIILCSVCTLMQYSVENLLGMYTIHSAGYFHLKLSPAYTYSHLALPNTGIEINVFPEKNMSVYTY